MRLLVLKSILIFTFCLHLIAAEVNLTAKVDKALITTGDLIIFTITLETPKNLDLVIPNIGDKIQGFRVVDFGLNPEKIVDEKKISSMWYKLQADLTGSYILPSIELKYKNSSNTEETIKSSEIFVEVESVLNKDKSKNKNQDIIDIKPLIPSPPIWPYYLLFSLLLILLISLVIYFIKKRNKNRTLQIKETPPHQVALSALDNLSFEPLKNFAFNLSEIIRIYFEKSFSLTVTDLTLEEIQKEIFSIPNPSDQLKKRFLNILEETDLIKFSDMIISTQECEKLKNDVKIFINETMPMKTSEKNDEGDSVI